MITPSQLIEIVEQTGHHPIGPSAASRWMNCPGSVELTLGIKDEGSPYAAEGTKAHALAELALLNNCSTDDLAALNIEDDFPDDMREYVQTYVDYVRGIADGERIFVEQVLDLKHIIPEGMGTADAIVIKGDTLHVIDLKYGMRKVEAEHNPQLQIYAAGALWKLLKSKKYNITKVVIHIHQPRAGGPSSWEVSTQNLLIFGKKISEAANRCLEDEAPLNPSEKACEWCRAKATCPALYQKSLELVGGDFEILPSVDRMSDEQIRLVLTNKSLIEKWLSSIEAEVFSRIEHGDSFDGFKMVAGRSQRKWNDDAETKLVSILGDNAYDKKLIGITTAEKILGKKQLEELGITEKPEGKPTLVPESDKRPALVAIADDFETVK